MIGYEEGDTCGRDGCEGTMVIEVDGCTCFLSAPCWVCINSLVCRDCLTRSGPDGDKAYEDYRG